MSGSGRGRGRICLVQPPLIQLNGPYPAPYYLRSFLEGRGWEVRVRDHSIGLFEKIFCGSGLGKIFADAEGALRGGSLGGPDRRRRYYLDRFRSEGGLWIALIDRLVGFLRGRDREWGHLLALANGTLPGGPRTDALLESLGGEVPPEAAPLLGTRLLEDLADFITLSLDPSFALVRYAPRIGGSFRDFGQVRAALDGYIMENFYRPLLGEEWKLWAGEGGEGGKGFAALGITIPFPGCLAAALVCARSARERFGPPLTIIAGGGYVNTELRFLEEGGLFDFVDYLSFDRGYGSWEAILEREAGGAGEGLAAEAVLYRTVYRSRKKSALIRDPEIAGGAAGADIGAGADFERFREADRLGVRTVFPDYQGLDFSRYLYPVDDENPMHRLWSDGHWLKAYLAQGCYWGRCIFCDTTLEYIRSFEPVDTEALFRHLCAQAAASGVRAVHLVDEAAPVESLLRLAELNRGAGLPLVFWGNIRYDRSFSPDRAAVLAAGGLLGVSAGIEVATGGGFKRLGKGLGLAEVVRACAAFKEAGILTHGYLIYGYWDSDDQEIIDSAETVRQLFAAGLLDSAFWHKFVLTRHSRLYDEWRRGLHPALVVLEEEEAAGGPPRFALNDLSFKGEEGSARFTEGLDRLLAGWMAADFAGPVGAAFPFKTPKPKVSPGAVAELLDAYAAGRDRDRAALPRGGGEGAGRLIFLGSRPLSPSGPGGHFGGEALFWRYGLRDHRLKTGGLEASRRIAALLEGASRPPGPDAAAFYREMEAILGPEAAPKTAPEGWNTLRQGGLVRL